MKINVLSPGFEFIFALGIITVLILPPLVMGKPTFELKVNIQNNDTTINGKNIKDLSATEHKKALIEIKGAHKGTIYLFRK